MSYKDTLLSPLEIGRRTCANRFFAAPMECCDADSEGNPTDLTRARYERLFNGGYGMVCLEAISVTLESLARKHQLLITRSNEKPLSAFVKHIRAVNPEPLFIFQLTHSGELSDPTFSRSVTPRPLPGFGGELLTDKEMDKIVDQFVLAAKIANAVGADGVDIKLAGGYLGTQLLRPYNNRDWKYGGSWERRSRFAFEVFERIQKEIHDDRFLVGSKIAVWEGFPGGFGSPGLDSVVYDLTEPTALIKGLEERGATFFHESAGSPAATLDLATAGKRAPYFAYLHSCFARDIKKIVKVETVVIGSNYAVYGNGRNGLLAESPEEASVFAFGARNVEQGVNDMIALGRQSLADPFLPAKYRDGQEGEIDFCTLCDNCSELLIRQANIGCTTYNPYYRDVLKHTREQHGGALKIRH
ncbi:MAG: 2,4-dienoyl-CoA reductase [Actinobacteria bacterium RBG_16_64_13]|nr:MAG: 2,4-dienoyl-CoA reductase [Actinobacteria bacterium RBG_16_64_13]